MRIKFETAPFTKALRGIERQTKFACARTLSEVALSIYHDSQMRLGLYFKVRSGWMARRFKTHMATRDKLVAWVGHMDAFMADQALGGTKNVQSGSKNQGVPQQGNVPGAIPMPRGTGGERPTYRRQNWPRQLIAAIEKYEQRMGKAGLKKKGSKSRERAVINANKTRAGSNRLVWMEHAKIPTLAIRVASGQGRGKYVPLWFMIGGPVKIPKRWKFFEDGEHMARTFVPPFFQKYFKESIAMIGKP
jgi:hypothetical protein